MLASLDFRLFMFADVLIRAVIHRQQREHPFGIQGIDEAKMLSYLALLCVKSHLTF